MGRLTLILSFGLRSNYGDIKTTISSVNERIAAGLTTYTKGYFAEYEMKYQQEEIFSEQNP